MNETAENNSEKVVIKEERDAIFENNFYKKNIFYIHNACTQYKFNFLSSSKLKNNVNNWYDNLEKIDK
jgi:hypothetical protein